MPLPQELDAINYEEVADLAADRKVLATWKLLVRDDVTNEVWEAVPAQLTGVIVPAVAVSTNALPNVALALDKTSLIIGQTVTLTATATDSDGTIAKVEFFDVVTKIGEVLGSGPYALAYTPSTTGSHSLTAKATDNQGGSRTTAPINLPVTVAPNLAPTIALYASAATVQQGTALTLTATATDSDGTVVKVEFFDGATKIGETVSVPHSISFAPGIAGSHQLSAKATDNSGAMTVSAPVIVSVVPNAANQAPTASLSIIANNPTVGQAVLLNATAADSDGTVVLVEFYNSGTKIGERAQSPYSISYTPTATGTYFFSAKATDNSGASTQTGSSYLLVGAAVAATSVPSSPYNLVAVAGNNSVSVSLTAPASPGSSPVTGYNWYRNDFTSPLAINVGATFVDNQAINGVTYTYTASAVNASGPSNPSAPSNQAKPLAPAVVTAPSAPSIIAVTAASNSVLVSFAAPSSNGGAAISGYNVYRGVALLGTTASTANSYTDGTALNGNTYSYTVAAINSAGISPQSASVSVAMPAATVAATAPGVPTNPTATLGTASATPTITVTATAPAVPSGQPATTGFTIYRNGVALSGAVNVALPYADTTAVNGTSYYYTVAAVNSAGTGAPSVYSNYVTPVAPAVAYNTTLTGPSASPASGQPGAGITLTTAGAADVLKFNTITGGSTIAQRMNLSIGGTVVAAVDFPTSYLGAGFSYTPVGGTLRSGVFTNGTVTL
jgi:fibronectin type 3 domain-containing protein